MVAAVAAVVALRHVTEMVPLEVRVAVVVEITILQILTQAELAQQVKAMLAELETVAHLRMLVPAVVELEQQVQMEQTPLVVTVV